MCENNPELLAGYGAEGGRVESASSRNLWRCHQVGDFLPHLSIEVLKRVALRRLYTSSVIVDRKLCAPDFFGRAEVDLEPVGLVGRAVAGPPIDRGGFVVDTAIDGLLRRTAIDIVKGCAGVGETLTGAFASDCLIMTQCTRMSTVHFALQYTGHYVHTALGFMIN